MTDLIGWASTVILLLTVGRQAWSQWKQRSAAGLSRWLFVGRSRRGGLRGCSWLLDNYVFVVSNVFLLIIAAVGQGLYLRNSRRETERSSEARCGRDGAA